MLKDTTKDCEARFKNTEIKQLSVNFGDLNGAMEELLKAGSGNAEIDRLGGELSEARCDIKALKGKIAANKKKGCPDCGGDDDKKKGDDDKKKGGNGESADCDDTTKLRMRARYALGELHAREQEH